MKRAGFTMIELIFVIVILGILAAVALPKFVGVSEQAEQGKVKSFVGTLNRTVGPTLWSKSLAEDHSGKIASDGGDYCKKISEYVEIPDGISMDQDCQLSFTNVNPTTNTFTDGSLSQSPSWKVKFN